MDELGRWRFVLGRRTPETPAVKLTARLSQLAILVSAALVPALAIGLASTHPFMLPGRVHFVVVGLAALLAGGAATVVSVIAARRHDGHTVMVGGAFAVMAMLLLIHALATPGVLIGPNGVVQFAGALNVPVGATILAATGLPWLRRTPHVRRLLTAELCVLGVLAAGGAVALMSASRIAAVPAPSSLVADGIFGLSAVPITILACRAARTYLLTRRRADLCVAVGVIWLIGAQFGLLEFSMTQAAFWVAHVLEVSGIALVGVPTALDLRHGVASRSLIGDLRATALVEHEAAFLGSRVRALMVRLADADPSTEGHTRRVAALAVSIGERLGLTEPRLRELALGGLLHDIGKLAVPPQILNKPGRLSDAEFAVVRGHPGNGRALLEDLGGFSPRVLALVESHHERLDGAGYPRGIPADRLALEVRALTVADVFDALTADRVYRPAWSTERALALLDEETGTAFDARCVAALRAHLAAVSDGRAAALASAERHALPAAGRSHDVPIAT